MSYIGRGVDAISNVEKLDNITFNGGTTYALTKSSAAFTPVGANNILVSIDGVIQQGNFSVSTTNIVFDWSPTSSNTCNFILHYGTGVLNVPADGSIVAAKMAANSVDSDAYVDGSIDAVHMSANSIDSDSYVDASIDTAHIGATQVTGAKLNTDVISAQTALAVAPADTDEFMVSDAGVLKRIDYSLIKGGGASEQFLVYKSSDQSPLTTATWTKVTFDTEDIDTGSNFASDKYVAPSDGKYFFYTQVRNMTSIDTNIQLSKLSFYKNGAHFISISEDYTASYLKKRNMTMSGMLDLSATDYVEVYSQIQRSGGSPTLSISGASNRYTLFMGWKM